MAVASDWLSIPLPLGGEFQGNVRVGFRPKFLFTTPPDTTPPPPPAEQPTDGTAWSDASLDALDPDESGKSRGH